MPFALQGPDASTLADAIDGAAAGAARGGGVFAFATKRGIQRFFAIRGIESLLERNHPLTLIVGTDAITNAETLLTLEEFAAKYASLTTLAFIHDLPSTFHPKFCWFVQGRSARLVVGSGNLTSSGLGGSSAPPRAVGNWEALSSLSLSGKEALNTVNGINDWIVANRASDNLLPINHDDIRTRAIANSRIQYVRPRTLRVNAQAAAMAVVEEIRATPEPCPSPVLLREIPQNRSGQADVSKKGLAFFGFEGSPKTVLIQYVGLDNNPGEVVERRLFQNASQNYRIEIREVAALDDIRGDDDGRTILVAVQLDESAFRYAVVPADHPSYPEVSHLLGPIATKGRRYMRTAFLDAAALKAGWPTAPSRLFPVAAIAAVDID